MIGGDLLGVLHDAQKAAYSPDPNRIRLRKDDYEVAGRIFTELPDRWMVYVKNVQPAGMILTFKKGEWERV